MAHSLFPSCTCCHKFGAHFFHCTLLIAGLLLAHALPLVRAEDVDFQEQVAPILTLRCLACHSESTVEGGLNLTHRVALLAGGDTGPALVAGKPDESHLFKRIVAGEMPPTENGISQKLSAEEIAVLRLWIESGSPWPEELTLNPFATTSDVRAGLDWWSLQPVQRPEVPEVNAGNRVQNPIDAFILARLEEHAMAMAPPAGRRKLIRRVYFDLLGLPPTPEQSDAFVADESPKSYERLIDKLLSSKHYGERWARFWLDVVRYAESSGYERDHPKPNIWRYRDWVIRAFNDDMPYDRFVAEQLAGDEVPWRDEQTVIATGMIRAGTWNDEPNDPADYLYERLEDMVHVSSSAFLGLTVKCARCHDHKFDPIRQTDYYRLASFFWAGYIGQSHHGGPSTEQLGFDVFGWTDKSSVPEPFCLLIKGDRHRPGTVVEPGFLSAIPELDRPLYSPPAGSKTSHRRLQFAHWITEKRNPLTARVLVNRLWQHHFGKAIVRSPNNFGFKSDPPTHPQLLDWLAAEFMDGDWKIKRLHKLIMMSSVYRQASIHPEQDSYVDMDFENRRFWRQNRRRLDAEALRDAMLEVSGQLNRSVGGRSFYPRASSEALEGLSNKGNAWGRSSLSDRCRRSIYMVTRRSRLLPLMTTFDFSDTTLPCAKRDVTTVAPQALAMMNNHFVHAQSTALAQRLEADRGDDVEAQVIRAWRLVLGRLPTLAEQSGALDHLAQQHEHFAAMLSEQTASGGGDQVLKPRDGLRLWLRADQGVKVDDRQGVISWQDKVRPERTTIPLVATQSDPRHRPHLRSRESLGGQLAVHFDGDQKFLQLQGPRLLEKPANWFTVIAVVTDDSTDSAPREILSNWQTDDHEGHSVFLGTAAQGHVRFTDHFANAGVLDTPTHPLVLAVINSSTDTTTYQNRRLLARRGRLDHFDVTSPYVIGTQGNMGGEYWQGDLAELLVYERAIYEAEYEEIWNYLADRYSLEDRQAPGAGQLALASLCHVLLSTNEFVYVD